MNKSLIQSKAMPLVASKIALCVGWVTVGKQNDAVGLKGNHRSHWQPLLGLFFIYDYLRS
ncbi:hypothetical protein ACFODZ_16745 [Marinicella sediminis]|uniref:Uncharacterized protein n=1 Tax=Marinicella sediminis TaxID=1792834 RepID=A0ABV7JCQ2_9GAMM|nr:hypothetical protein [Marinicella sediminis]